MTFLSQLLNRFWDALDALERTRREAWLAQSTDVCDLEARIRDLERHAAQSAW